jgi:hypothetical protein
MITLKDIKTAVVSVLNSNFTQEVQSSDVKEGFKRPSFFVELDNATSSSTEEQKHRGLTIRIYYFPSDRNKNSIELLDIQEALENAFDLKLTVLDRKFTINETESETTDGVLTFSFDIEYEEGKVIAVVPLMDSLDIKEG